jgi:hypothetical protein
MRSLFVQRSNGKAELPETFPIRCQLSPAVPKSSVNSFESNKIPATFQLSNPTVLFDIKIINIAELVRHWLIEEILVQESLNVQRNPPKINLFH